MTDHQKAYIEACTVLGWTFDIRATNAEASMPRVVMALVGEIRDLRQQVEGHCERIAKQSELLSKRAEK